MLCAAAQNCWNCCDIQNCGQYCTSKKHFNLRTACQGSTNPEGHFDGSDPDPFSELNLFKLVK